MTELMKKLTKLTSTVDKLIEDGKKVVAAALEVKETLPKKPPDDKEKV